MECLELHKKHKENSTGVHLYLVKIENLLWK